MGLEKVIEQIKQEGDRKIQNLLEEAKHQAAQILQTMEKQLEEQSAQKKEELKHQLLTLKTQEESAAEIEVKKVRLNAEKGILIDAYQECLASLASLPHKTILAALLHRIQQEMPEAAVIYSNTRDEADVRSLSSVRYGGTINCLGGVVAENAEKTLTIDFRYETIAAAVWERYLKEIAQSLFG